MDNYIIDPPSPYASVEDWKQFLNDLQTLALTAEIAEYIREAKAMIEEKEKAAI